MSDAPVNPAAFAGLLAQLGADRHLRGLSSPATARSPAGPAAGPRHRAGQRPPNYAIGSFELTFRTLGATTLRARLTIANFGPSAETLKAPLTGDGNPPVDAQAAVELGEVVTLEFPKPPLARVTCAHL